MPVSAQGGRNLRQHSMWDVLANTINGESSDLYLVLDEAHRGMKPPRDRTSIVQRIISGEAGSNPPVPVVWGISATIDRFTAAMKGILGRTEYPFVEVDIDKVRASGLVKDEIGLDEPDESGTFDNVTRRGRRLSAGLRAAMGGLRRCRERTRGAADHGGAGRRQVHA